MSFLEGLKQLFRAGPGRAPSADRAIACSAVTPEARRVFPTLASALGPRGTYVPAALLAQKARSVSEGVIAALEASTTKGDGARPGVQGWLEELERELGSDAEAGGAPRAAARERIRAAIDIGRTGYTGRAVARELLADPLRSRPIGLYAWNDELGRAFVRDRFLQERLPDAEGHALASALARSPELRQPYMQFLRRTARLADRLARPGLGMGPAGALDPRDTAEAVFPASRGIDDFHGGGLAFLDAVKRGECDLTPDSDAGFYRHQLFALTALLLPDKTPEAASRRIDRAYAHALEQLAALGLFYARETHAKQLEILDLLSPPEGRVRRTVYPNLTIEPVPTFYRLTGDALRFLRGVVAEGWGDASLGLPLVGPEGPLAKTIEAGLDEGVALCDAASEVASRELDGPADDPGCEALRARLRPLRSDPDACGDARAMVPIARDGAGQVLAMVFLGWEMHRLEVRLTRWKGAGKDVELGTEVHPLPIPVVREVLLDADALVDRAAFRAVCDRCIAQ